MASKETAVNKLGRRLAQSQKGFVFRPQPLGNLLAKAVEASSKPLQPNRLLKKSAERGLVFAFAA